MSSWPTITNKKIEIQKVIMTNPKPESQKEKGVGSES